MRRVIPPPESRDLTETLVLSSNPLAANARVLFPIARAASRGLAQPGFNEVALCVASSRRRSRATSQKP